MGNQKEIIKSLEWVAHKLYPGKKDHYHLGTMFHSTKGKIYGRNWGKDNH